MVQRSPFLTQSGGGEAEPTVVGPGDDHIADARLIPISQPHLQSGRDVAKAMIASFAVQVRDKLSGRGEHDRIQS